MQGSWRTPVVVLLCGMIALSLAAGLRFSFNVLFFPMLTTDVARGALESATVKFLVLSSYVTVVAILFGPIFAALSDRVGTGKILAAGGISLASGTMLMFFDVDNQHLIWIAGVFLGIGFSAVGLPIVLGVIVRKATPRRYALNLGLGTAAAMSALLVYSAPIGQLAKIADAQTVAIILAGAVLLIVPIAFVLRGPANGSDEVELTAGPKMTATIIGAFKTSAFWMLGLALGLIGFQTGIIELSLVKLFHRGAGFEGDAIAIALFGMFNVFGIVTWCSLGNRLPTKVLLAAICLFLSAATAATVLTAHPAQYGVWLAAVMGFCSAATIPLTGLVLIRRFGVRYLATLLGLVFFAYVAMKYIAGIIVSSADPTAGIEFLWWVAAACGGVATVLYISVKGEAVTGQTSAVP